MPVRAKICGLSTEATLDAAVAGGASHVGFVFFPPSPRNVAFDRVAGLAGAVPSQVGKVGVFVEPDDALIDAACAAGRLDAIQLHKTAADRVLFDAKTPDHAVLPGGMGMRFDWRLLAGFDHPLPWALSGGLDAGNVAEAVGITGARRVDVSSGVESAPGTKDEAKIAAFLRAVAAL